MIIKHDESSTYREIGEDDKRDFQQFVQQLLDVDRIESSAAKGIAMKIVSDGTEGLSKKQEDTFVEYGLKKYNYIESCGLCENSIPWHEMYDALDDEYCSECRHKVETDL